MLKNKNILAEILIVIPEQDFLISFLHIIPVTHELLSLDEKRDITQLLSVQKLLQP